MSKIFKYLLLICLFFAVINAFSQFTNTGVHVSIPTGAFINAQCDIINDNSGPNTGTINNEGVVITTGNIVNNGSFLAIPQSYVRLEGAQQDLSGLQPYHFGRLVIDGTADKNLSVAANILDSLVFNANKIVINNNDLILLSNANVRNPGSSRFVVTNANGSLIKKSLPLSTDFLFPVGDAINSYKPVIINSIGTLDTFAVRVIDGVTPPDLTSVQKTYIIKESNPLSSTASVTLGWNSIDEGIDFTPAQAMIWQHISGAWMPQAGTPGATPNTPATDLKQQSTGIQFLSAVADSFIVKSSAPPTVVTHPQPIAICENDSAFFSVSATGIDSLTYQWQVNCSGTWVNVLNGGVSPNYSGATDSILVLANVPYSSNGCLYRCVVGTIAGTTPSDPAVLTVFPLPLAYIVGDTAICEGDYALLTAGLGTSYLWNTGETTENITVLPFPPPMQSYSVTVTDNNSCVNTAFVNVNITPIFTVDITSDYAPDHKITTGQTITFTATPPYYDTYVFVVGGDTVQTSGSNIYSTSSIASDALVTVIAWVNNCSASDSLFVFVKPLPNAFTPFDLDGVNDIFGKGLDLVIYNRWAQVLYTGKDGWDGTYNGKNVSPGTYFYILTMPAQSGEPQVFRGSVTIVSSH